MVATPTQTDTYNTALDIFDRTHPLRVDADENLKVTGTFTFTPSGTQDVNIVSSITLPVSIAATVNVAGTINAIQSGAWTTGRTWNLSSSTDSVNIGNFPATQPVSGTVAVTQSTTPWVVDGSGVTQPVSGTVSVGNFPAKQAVDNLTQLIPFEFDYINLTPSGTNPTAVVYKTGGASGTTVATLTLVYDANNNVETITRT